MTKLLESNDDLIAMMPASQYLSFLFLFLSTLLTTLLSLVSSSLSSLSHQDLFFYFSTILESMNNRHFIFRVIPWKNNFFGVTLILLKIVGLFCYFSTFFKYIIPKKEQLSKNKPIKILFFYFLCDFIFRSIYKTPLEC